MNSIKKEVQKFQYSFCSYSTRPPYIYSKLLFCFNTASVLIQQIVRIFPMQIISFNTASVLIQQEEAREELERIAFQYSFCSYSTLKNLTKNMAQSCFNTASVLIQQLASISHLYSWSVSIQLLFLFN